MSGEGITRFEAAHTDQALPAARYGELGARLIAWREILVGLGGIGQRAHRYGGAGFGNVSGRLGPFPGARGARRFLISGTQTGGRRCVGLDNLCVVERYQIAHNRVVSAGPVRPSSESMTQGAVYDLAPHIRFVLHVHCPVVWRQARRLGLPATSPAIPYGTPEMAREVGRLYRDTALPARRILSMGGHEDGLVVFGRTPEEAGQALLATLARAYEHVCRQQGSLCTSQP